MTLSIINDKKIVPGSLWQCVYIMNDYSQHLQMFSTSDIISQFHEGYDVRRGPKVGEYFWSICAVKFSKYYDAITPDYVICLFKNQTVLLSRAYFNEGGCVKLLNR